MTCSRHVTNEPRKNNLFIQTQPLAGARGSAWHFDRAATARSCEKMGDARNREFRVNSGLTRGPRTRSERPSDDLASPNEPGWTASGIFSQLPRERLRRNGSPPTAPK